MRRNRKDKRGKNGGARPGAGRPPNDSERIWGQISRSTRVSLDRYARQIGISKSERRVYWEKIFTALLGKVELQEPEYLTLARAITVRKAA